MKIGPGSSHNQPLGPVPAIIGTLGLTLDVCKPTCMHNAYSPS